MDMKELHPFVILIILVGMVLSVGVLVFDKFSLAVPTKAEANITLSEVVNSSTGDNLISGIGNITSAEVYNNTGETIPSSLYTLWTDPADDKEYLNTTENSSMTADSIYVIANYDEFDTPTRTSMLSMSTELGNVSTNWVGLLITVAILAIILVLVISSFGAGRT